MCPICQELCIDPVAPYSCQDKPHIICSKCYQYSVKANVTSCSICRAEQKSVNNPHPVCTQLKKRIDEEQAICPLCDYMTSFSRVNEHLTHGCSTVTCGFCENNFMDKDTLLEHSKICSEKQILKMKRKKSYYHSHDPVSKALKLLDSEETGSGNLCQSERSAYQIIIRDLLLDKNSSSLPASPEILSVIEVRHDDVKQFQLPASFTESEKEEITICEFETVRLCHHKKSFRSEVRVALNTNDYRIKASSYTFGFRGDCPPPDCYDIIEKEHFIVK